MNIKVVAAAIALALAAPVAQAGCDGIEDKKEMKACEKKAKAQAKADANSTPFEPSALDASFSKWDGDANPFATDDYRVRVTSAGIASVDEYLAKAYGIQAAVVFAEYIVAEVGAGNADAIAAVPTLADMLDKVVADGEALVTEGQALPDSLKETLEPADAMKLPKAVGAIGGAVGAVTGAIGSAPDVIKALGALAADPSAAAGAAAGVAAEAGAAAAGDVAGDAVDAAGDAAGEAVEAVEAVTK